MHRYGLVYLWHNRQLQNQNRSITKERRDGQPPSPPRNQKRGQLTQNQHSKHLNSIQSEPHPEGSTKLDEFQSPENVEISRARADVERAVRRVDLTGRDLEQAQKRLSQIHAGFLTLAPTDTSAAQTYNNLMQLSKKETERLEKERLKAVSELQAKQQLLTRLTHRKCSM